MARDMLDEELAHKKRKKRGTARLGFQPPPCKMDHLWNYPHDSPTIWHLCEIGNVVMD